MIIVRSRPPARKPIQKQPTRNSKLRRHLRFLRDTFLTKGRIGEMIFSDCLRICDDTHNRYLYASGVKAEDFREWQIKNQNRIFEFEEVVRDLVEIYANKTLITTQYRWEFNNKRYDFVLEWEDVNFKKRSVLFECRHSDPGRWASREDQISEGIDKLNSYRKLNDSQMKTKYDLCVLLVDFPYPKGEAIDLLEDDIVILNFSLLRELILGLNKWCEFTTEHVMQSGFLGSPKVEEEEQDLDY